MFNESNLEHPIADDEDPMLRLFCFGANHDKYCLLILVHLNCLIVVFAHFDFNFVWPIIWPHHEARRWTISSKDEGMVWRVRPTYDGYLDQRKRTLLRHHPRMRWHSWWVHICWRNTMPPLSQRRWLHWKMKDKSWPKTVGELLNGIFNSGYDTIKKWFLKPEQVKIAQDRDTPAEVVEDKVAPGWCGKPKG